MARAKHGSYLFQRPGSSNWWIRLRSPGGRQEKSLGTADKRQAELLALPLITQHKAALMAVRPRLETVWACRLVPGLHDNPDGGRIAATKRELSFYDAAGKLLRTEPNGGPEQRLMAGPYARQAQAIRVARSRSLLEPRRERPAASAKSGDDAIFETYLKHANITGFFEREARSVWALFKQLTSSKPLKECDRDDGRKLVAHYEGQGLKSATIRKKVTWVNAACNLAIREGKLRFNPFGSIVPKRNDAQTRLPLSEADMKACRHNLDKLGKSDQVLFRLLAATGMRLSEAFEIDGELKERGVRYVIVGKKTDQSLRRVPLPADALAHLQRRIKGRLFTSGGAPAASKRLNRFLRDDCGITDRNKVVHSLRHRAQDRLRAAGCPQDVRWALLGHEEKTVAAGYGEGFPVPMLRKWIDRIGF